MYNKAVPKEPAVQPGPAVLGHSRQWRKLLTLLLALLLGWWLWPLFFPAAEALAPAAAGG